MIAYVKGEITFRSPTYVVVETGGIGYHVNISLHTYEKIENLTRVKLFTHFHVKEDSQTLYGFAEEAERTLFIQLISVSGIGPNTARILISSMTPEEAREAILTEDVRSLSGIKGIGPKTARRLIVELKDKMLKDGGEIGVISGTISAMNDSKQEALSALLALGFNRIQIQKSLNKVLKQQPGTQDVEVLVKLALKNLSS